MASPLHSNQSPSPSSGLQGPLNLLHFYPSDFISYHIFLEHPIPASLALWCLSNARLTPTSRLLHLLFMFTLPGMLFLQTPVASHHSLPPGLCSNITFSDTFLQPSCLKWQLSQLSSYSTNTSGLPFSHHYWISILTVCFSILECKLHEAGLFLWPICSCILQHLEQSLVQRGGPIYWLNNRRET